MTSEIASRIPAHKRRDFFAQQSRFFFFPFISSDDATQSSTRGKCIFAQQDILWGHIFFG